MIGTIMSQNFLLEIVIPGIGSNVDLSGYVPFILSFT
jgi:hypothetical protein